MDKGKMGMGEGRMGMEKGWLCSHLNHKELQPDQTITSHPQPLESISPSPSPQSTQQVSPDPKNTPAPSKEGKPPHQTPGTFSPAHFPQSCGDPRAEGLDMELRGCAGAAPGARWLREGQGLAGPGCPRGHRRCHRASPSPGSATGRQDRRLHRRCGKSIPAPISPFFFSQRFFQILAFPRMWGRKGGREKGEEGVSQLEQSLG